jgi:hypothetical protein
MIEPSPRAVKNPLMRKLLLVALALTCVLFLVNLLLAANILDRKFYISLLEPIITTDGHITKVAAGLWIIQCAILVVVLAVFSFVIRKDGFRISRTSAIAYAGAALLLILQLLFPYHPFFCGENRFIENVTFVLALAAAVLMLKLFVRSRGASSFRRSIIFILFLCFFFFAMEEISWGQSIFGFRTTEAVAKINIQHELNIHNMFPYLNYSFYIAFYVLALLFLYRDTILSRIRKPSMHETVDLFLPPPDFYLFSLHVLTLPLLSWRIAYFEAAEVLAAVMVVTYAVHLGQRMRKLKKPA